MIDLRFEPFPEIKTAIYIYLIYHLIFSLNKILFPLFLIR